MPQIANQDYDIVAPKYANTVEKDAYALGQIKGHLLRGTAFDVLVQRYKNEGKLSRIVSVDNVSAEIFWSASPYYVRLVAAHTQEQFLGLAAVQEACELTTNLPEVGLGDDEESLVEVETSKYICVDGKLVSPSVDDYDRISGFTITENSPAQGDDWANISYEDLQKLIGLPF